MEEKMKLVCCVMGQNCEEHLRMSLPPLEHEEVLLVYLDGGSTDKSKEVAAEYGAVILENEYRQDNKDMNGKQRNFYLKYLKEHHMGSWCLCLDADEVLDDLSALLSFLKEIDGDARKQVAYDVHMRHLVGCLAHEDATQDRHYAPGRLFNVSEAWEYPLGEHVVLRSRLGDLPRMKCDAVTIWHLAYAPMFHVRRRYLKNLEHSNVHSQEFLKQWYWAHLFGNYARKALHPNQLPSSILRFYRIDPDEVYFHGRGLELKHFQDAIDWRDTFCPESVLELGCGLGPRVYAMRQVGIKKADGIELSRWAVENALTGIMQGDITECKAMEQYDLVVAYDVLEHLSADVLDKALQFAKESCRRHFLVSVPVIGDPNLEADPTHRIKESKSWWVERIEVAGFFRVGVPQHFQFKEQLLIFEVSE